jgi:hypothetical protein
MRKTVGFEPRFLHKQDVMEIEHHILEGKCHHGKEELECYIPELFIDNKWVGLLKEGEYILKYGFNPLAICKKCEGSGLHCYLNGKLELIYSNEKCKECGGNGLRKGEKHDNIDYVNSVVKLKKEQYIEYLKLKKMFEDE